MPKVILIDGGKYVFASIEQWGGLYLAAIKEECRRIDPNYNEETDLEIFATAQKNVDYNLRTRKLYISSSDYTFFSMLISMLKKVKVDQGDLVILAMDGQNSWRKAFYPLYKANRGEVRDKKTHIDYPEHYARIQEVIDLLQQNSEIHCVKLNDAFTYEDLINSPEGMKFIEPDVRKFSQSYGIESDDLLAVGSKYFRDQEVICVTGDRDCYQLAYYPNVKVFSSNLKTPKGKNGAYLIDVDPLKIISEKCRKGDESDNILVDPDYPEQDSEVRRFIIDLLNIPTFLEAPVIEEFKRLVPKKNNFNNLPFPNSLANRFPEIYTEKNYVSFEYCMKQHQRKLKELQDKKDAAKEEARLRREAKKQERLAKKEAEKKQKQAEKELTKEKSNV